MTISIVIVSYNSARFLEKHLNSLLRQAVPFKEIIVVDNASEDDSEEIIKRFGERVQLIPRQENTGYAHAANTGIDAADSDLVVVANPDTVFEESFNERVLAAFEEDPDISLLSPLILRFDRKTVDSAGQARSRSLYPLERGFNQPLEDVEIKAGPVFSVCGAATVFRRRALNTLKMDGQYYDEDFFIFWEDFDIGWRAQLLDLKTVFLPEALVYHYRSGTLEKNFLSRFSLALARPSFIKYHLVKNRYLTLIKNFRFKTDTRCLPFVLLKDLIWVPLLTFSSPKIIIPLMKSAKTIKRAFKKRKELSRRIKNGKSR
jgi:GT2 family glycosyltransferase